jgi:ribosomal protein L32
MPVPAKRRASSQKYRRRIHQRLDKTQLVKDTQGNLILPHRASPIDGTYRGRVVIDVSRATARKSAKKKSAAA